jgi:hypothetical protein
VQCAWSGIAQPFLTELDRLDPENLSQQRLVLPNLADHRVGCLPLEEELDDLLGLGTDDAVEKHAAGRRQLLEMPNGGAAAPVRRLRWGHRSKRGDRGDSQRDYLRQARPFNVGAADPPCVGDPCLRCGRGRAGAGSR